MANSLFGLFSRKIKVSLVSAQKKRVLFVTSSLNLGGAERQLLMLCLKLKNQVDVQIVSLESEGPLKEKYLQAFPRMLLLKKKNPLRQMNSLRKIIRISKPDVVITWLYRADLIGGLAAKLAGNIPVIWSARNSAIPNFSIWKKFLLSFCSRIIPRIIVANGSPAYEFHSSLGYQSHKLIVIPNLLASWTLNTSSKSRLLVENLDIEELRIGIAARQVSGKGIIETIDTLYEGRLDLPTIDLTIIGQESPESVSWKLQGKYRGLTVIELKSDEELSRWFEGLDIYLMSSTAWESQPNSLLEAIAIGCPVLVSSSIDIQLSVPDLFLFDSDVPNSLCMRINNLILKRNLVAHQINLLQQTTLLNLGLEKVLLEWKSSIDRAAKIEF